MKVPVWPFVNPRNANAVRGETLRIAVPELEVNVKKLLVGEMAKTPTPFPTVVFRVARNETEL